MSEFDYSKYCNEELFKEFPFLETDPKSKENFEYWKYHDTGTAHSLYEGVFCHYVVDLFQGQEKNRELLKRVFRFIEKIAINKNGYVANVVAVSFIEPLLCYVKPPKLVVPYLGRESLRMAKHTATFRYGWNADPKTWN